MSLFAAWARFLRASRGSWTRPSSLGGAMVALALAAAVGRADTVTEWNAIMVTTVGASPTNPHWQSRWGAIVQLSVFEAVNAIERDYEPYLGVIDAPAGASPEAAVIAAAHRALVGVRPDRVEDLDLARGLALAAIPDGPSKDDGIAVGEAAAAAMLLLRQNDGWDAPATYTPGTEPGDWRPIGSATPSLPGWGQVTPFAMTSGSQFRLPPPPGLHTRTYAANYEEVKLLGRLDSPLRPQDRTDVASFFAGTSPVQAWNPAARQAALAQGTTLAENARIFAHLAMAMADASIAAYETKYHYGFWRPQAAIREGDTDGNSRTVADPDWTPLITTPSFPSYASAHATLSGAARRVLEKSLGKEGHDITLTNSNLPGIVLEYAAWREITDDIDDARIYGGIHFRFEQEAGAKQGRQVGSHVLENFLRPVDESGELIEDE